MVDIFDKNLLSKYYNEISSFILPPLLDSIVQK